MRRALESALKETQKMKGREKSLLRDLIELQRKLITVIHILAREVEAPVNFGVRYLRFAHGIAFDLNEKARLLASIVSNSPL